MLQALDALGLSLVSGPNQAGSAEKEMLGATLELEVENQLFCKIRENNG